MRHVNPFALLDVQMCPKCDAAAQRELERRAQKQLDLAHGMRWFLAPKRAGLDRERDCVQDASELYAFLHIFHPEHAPRTPYEAAKLMGREADYPEYARWLERDRARKRRQLRKEMEACRAS